MSGSLPCVGLPLSREQEWIDACGSLLSFVKVSKKSTGATLRALNLPVVS